MKKTIVMLFALAISIQVYGMGKQEFKFEKIPEKKEFIYMEGPKKTFFTGRKFTRKKDTEISEVKEEKIPTVIFDKDKNLYNIWRNTMIKKPKEVKEGRLGVLYDAVNALSAKTKVHSYFDVYDYQYLAKGQPLQKDIEMYDEVYDMAPLAIAGNLKKPIFLIVLEIDKSKHWMYDEPDSRKIKNKDIPYIYEVKIFYYTPEDKIAFARFSDVEITRGKFSALLKDLIYKIYTFNSKSYQKVETQRKEQFKTQRSKQRLHDIGIVTQS